LLGKYDAVSVSKRNAHGKLPIDLLIESNGVSNRESVEYMASIFRLLKAYPEIVMNIFVRKLLIRVRMERRGSSAMYERGEVKGAADGLDILCYIIQLLHFMSTSKREESFKAEAKKAHKRKRKYA